MPSAFEYNSLSFFVLVVSDNFCIFYTLNKKNFFCFLQHDILRLNQHSLCSLPIFSIHFYFIFLLFTLYSSPVLTFSFIRTFAVTYCNSFCFSFIRGGILLQSAYDFFVLLTMKITELFKFIRSCKTGKIKTENCVCLYLWKRVNKVVCARHRKSKSSHIISTHGNTDTLTFEPNIHVRCNDTHSSCFASKLHNFLAFFFLSFVWNLLVLFVYSIFFSFYLFFFYFFILFYLEMKGKRFAELVVVGICILIHSYKVVVFFLFYIHIIFQVFLFFCLTFAVFFFFFLHSFQYKNPWQVECTRCISNALQPWYACVMKCKTLKYKPSVGLSYKRRIPLVSVFFPYNAITLLSLYRSPVAGLMGSASFFSIDSSFKVHCSTIHIHTIINDTMSLCYTCTGAIERKYSR